MEVAELLAPEEPVAVEPGVVEALVTSTEVVVVVAGGTEGNESEVLVELESLQNC